MDERVEKAMQQWPNVPDVYGWLSLDRRGRWLLRGESISNPKLIDFINRNYLRTPQGSFVFQNGPQRVHVALQATPWIASLNDAVDPIVVEDQSGAVISDIQAVYFSADGEVLISRPDGPALLRDSDLAACLSLLHDPKGQAVSDQGLESWLSGADKPGLMLKLGNKHWPVQRAPSESEWPAFFEFIPKQAPTKSQQSSAD